jgi:hypothetical protein
MYYYKTMYPTLHYIIQMSRQMDDLSFSENERGTYLRYVTFSRKIKKGEIM